MMKNSLMIASLIVLLASCGAEKGESEKTVGVNLDAPVTGVASETAEDSFVLVTLPEKFGEMPAKRFVSTKNAKIIDSSGGEARITENSTVKIEGSIGADGIEATKVTIESKAVDLGVHLIPSQTVTIRTAEMLEKTLIGTVPPKFGDGWRLEETGSLRDVPGSKIYQYNKSEWKLILVDNPKTVEKFEITLYGPNKLVWAGTEDANGIVTKTK